MLLLKHPSAWLPPLFSLIVLAVLFGHVALYGFVQEADEGIAAHIFQILMAAQVPIIAFFALKWLPEQPKDALKVLALQFFAALVPFALVFSFEHFALVKDALQ